MIFGAILAGGTGSRMNIADMPKQFLPLGDKPIVVHTLEKFLLCGQFDAIYLGISSHNMSRPRRKLWSCRAAATATRRF